MLREMDQSSKVDKMVFPGDIITNVKNVKGLTILGPGLQRNTTPNTLLVTKAGRLTHKAPNFYWVENVQRQYIPKRGDLVVGVVAKKGGDVLKVDIGSAELASLSVFAFEGATKKQKPDLQIGDVIYAKCVSAHREMEPELVCVDKYFKAGNLGPLSNDGFIINVKQNLVYMLLNPENPLLQTLGKKFPLEVAIGVNGKVWLNTKSPRDTMTLMNALYAAENQTQKDIINLCRQH